MTATADPLTPPPTPESAPSLPFTIRMFAEETSSPWTASGFRSIATHLERGDSWQKSVDSAGRRLPRFLRGVFTIAQRSGSIEQVIGDYLAGSRRTRRANRRVIGALLYPGLLLLAAAIMAIGIFTFVIPPFKAMFIDFGMELPAPTKVLVEVSDFVVATWMFILTGMVVVALLLAVMFLTTRLPFSAPFVRLLQSIPILGTASQLAAASEFCILLGMLVRARIPLPEAFRLTAAGLRDANLRVGCQRLARKVEAGESPAYAASILPHFGPRLAQLLRHADHEKTLAEILKAHGELFAIQAEAQAGIAVVWMQPVLLLFVALLGGFVVIALFLPLIRLLNALA
jgi:type IV pilus assembly protein PilC